MKEEGGYVAVFRQNSSKCGLQTSQARCLKCAHCGAVGSSLSARIAASTNGFDLLRGIVDERLLLLTVETDPQHNAQVVEHGFNASWIHLPMHEIRQSAG
jgi:hypothetical protein